MNHPYRLANGAASVCEPAQCAGCMACVDICPKAAINVVDMADHMDAEIDEDRCISCGLCHRVCQTNQSAELWKTIESWQGWADSEIRQVSSSGGFTSAIEKAFVKSGGIVCSCKLEGGEFCFVLAWDIDDLDGFAGSKYVKSNAKGAYRAVASELNAGHKVLFIGLPCQVSAVRNFSTAKCKGDAADRLYCIDLICHGTPSAKVLRKAISEYGYDLADVKRMWFRHNSDFCLSIDTNRLAPDGCIDRYTMAFLSGICYTENCYSCHYATRDRVGDLTLGDSWGTDLIEEEASGVSLSLVQTGKGRELLSMAGLELKPVDYWNAVSFNAQLSHPSQKTAQHDVFFSKLYQTGSVKRAVFAVFPKRCLKEDVKAMLDYLGLRAGTRHRCS